jgi:ABC-type uncharacterized transport system substrate-binding protein
VEGRNVTVEVRYAKGDSSRARDLAAELLRQGPDVMVSNSNLVTTILQTEVHTIPLIFISVSDPVGSGFINELARPGGQHYRIR